MVRATAPRTSRWVAPQASPLPCAVLRAYRAHFGCRLRPGLVVDLCYINAPDATTPSLMSMPFPVDYGFQEPTPYAR